MESYKHEFREEDIYPSPQEEVYLERQDLKHYHIVRLIRNSEGVFQCVQEYGQVGKPCTLPVIIPCVDRCEAARRCQALLDSKVKRDYSILRVVVGDETVYRADPVE